MSSEMERIKPELPATPDEWAATSTPESASSSLSSRLVAIIVVMALLVAAATVSALAWSSSSSRANRAESQLTTLQGQYDADTAGLQSDLDAAEASESRLSADNDSLHSQLAKLKGLVGALNAQVAGAGAASAAYEKASDCLNAILAAFNSITYQSQMYDAYYNVTTGPQCKGVISTTSR